MIKRALAITGCLLGTPVMAVSGGPEVEKSGDFLLIRRDHRVETVRPAQINERELVHLDPTYGWVTVDLTDCVAMLDPAATTTGRHKGLLRLADGQMFPGEALSGAQPDEDVLVWNHAWLGRMEVPLDRIMAVAFVEGAIPAPPADADVLLLANGDRLEGFVVALGDPISIEVQTDEEPQIIEIPLERAASVTMVTKQKRAAGWRVWLTDGTVIEVVRVLLGDGDLVRLVGTHFVVGREPDPLPLSELAAVLFDPEGMIPFALLSPVKVTGPPTRYVVPRPRALDEAAALGVSRIELRGPLTADYALPPGGWYFHAEAELDRAARGWGDCELVIRDDRAELFRARLNAENPMASIGITVHGTRLTIEITEGSTGPIQDHVVLSRAMLLRSDQ